MDIRKNTSGKVLTIFLIIAIILAVSIAATSIFFFQIEISRRKTAEADLETTKTSHTKALKDLEDTKKQLTLLEAKNKEMDERVNSLLDELELEEGLKEEMKIEISSLKEKLDAATKAREEFEKKLETGLKESEARIVELEAKLTKEINQKLALEDELKSAKAGLAQGGMPVEVLDPKKTEELVKEIQVQEQKDLQEQAKKDPVDLEPIVVVPEEIPEGRILSVDSDTDFVIINLGEKDGVTLGRVLSVYRGKEYLGDIQITRVQPEMSAADLIPPFSAQLVRKNDQVVAK